MRRRSRTRRILKWVGLVGCVLVLAAWAASLHWTTVYQGTDWCVGLGMGSVLAFDFPASGRSPGDRHWHVRSETVEPGATRVGLRLPRFHWARLHGPTEYGMTYVGLLPLWLIFLAVGGATGLFWYRDRRPPPGHCRSCGYNLTGNISGVCPECGEQLVAS